AGDRRAAVWIRGGGGGALRSVGTRVAVGARPRRAAVRVRARRRWLADEVGGARETLVARRRLAQARGGADGIHRARRVGTSRHAPRPVGISAQAGPLVHVRFAHAAV